MLPQACAELVRTCFRSDSPTARSHCLACGSTHNEPRLSGRFFLLGAPLGGLGLGWSRSCFHVALLAQSERLRQL